MRRLAAALAGGALGLAIFTSLGGVALADKPAATTFVFVLNSEDERPQCAPATNASRGVAVLHVIDEATGTVEWQIVANNLPGTTTAAHIHLGVAGSPGPVVQPFTGVAGNEQGVIATGTFVNPLLIAAMRANPAAYYVNVHSTTCPPGVIRGQGGDHGP